MIFTTVVVVANPENLKIGSLSPPQDSLLGPSRNLGQSGSKTWGRRTLLRIDHELVTSKSSRTSESQDPVVRKARTSIFQAGKPLLPGHDNCGCGESRQGVSDNGPGIQQN